MLDFNKKDHITVTLAETGEKKYFLKGAVRSVMPVNGKEGEGPTRLRVSRDGPESEVVDYVVNDSTHDLVEILNGMPDDATRKDMEAQVIDERCDNAFYLLVNLERTYSRPDALMETLEQLAANAGADHVLHAPVAAAYADAKKKSLYLRVVDYLYRAERAQINPPAEDGLVVSFLGMGVLDQVKTGVEAMDMAAQAANRQARHRRSLDMYQTERRATYLQEKARLEALRDNRELTDRDRRELHRIINEHREAYGPAPEHRFVRDRKQGAFRPEGEVRDDLQKALRADAIVRAQRLRMNTRPADEGDDERQLERVPGRLSRKRDHDFGYER